MFHTSVIKVLLKKFIPEKNKILKLIFQKKIKNN